MQIQQQLWAAHGGWSETERIGTPVAPQLALVFGSTEALQAPGLLDEVRTRCPGARLVGCSSAGEICGTRVTDDSVAVTAIEFDSTQVASCLARISAHEEYAVGRRLASELPHEDLAHVLVFSEGIHVNGSALVQGLTDRLPSRVGVTGGLAGDGERFERTLVVLDEPVSDAVVAVGLYGDSLRVGCGSLGGWEPFGPERVVTRSEGSVLFELDGRSALALYKRYLGDQAKDLPASALLFPLSLRGRHDEESVVRTVLAVDEGNQSMTFAGNVPEGSYVRLMGAFFDRLVDGAIGAATRSQEGLIGGQAELALLISCVGRKMILRQRIEEEVEGVRDVLGPRPALTGFYSYGEIAPFKPLDRCALHNQTMTVTTLSEG